MEQYKEAWEQIPVADRKHCSMDPATPGKQVVHTRGQPLAAAGSVKVGTEDLLLANGKEVAAVESHMAAGAENTQTLWAAEAVGAAEGVDSKVVIEEEAAGEYLQCLSAVEKRFFEVDSAVLLKGNCKRLYSYHPEN